MPSVLQAFAQAHAPARKQRLVRQPRPELRPFVQIVWAIDAPGTGSGIEREHALPTGQMHLVFRLGDSGLRLFRHERDREGSLAGLALIGGARDSFYIREVSGPQCSVGVQLRPGAAEILFRAPAEEFTGHHTSLENVWGRQASSIHDRIAMLTSLEERMDALEAILVARIGCARAMHPAVARALREFTVTHDVGRIVRESGYSHRTLSSQFRRAVGLGPKEYTRILRLQQVLKRLPQSKSLAELAADAGYSDQAHFSREFRAFAGVTPGEYRQRVPRAQHHLPVAGSRR